MKKNNVCTCIAMTVLCLILSIFTSSAVFASDEKKGRINIECGYQNMQWFLYRIGDAAEDKSIDYKNAFIKNNLPQGPLSYDQLQNLAYTFENYITINGIIPDQSGITGISGTISFVVDEGWYIAIPSKLTTDEKIYRSTPVIVCVSSLDIYSDNWGQEVTVYPKTDESENDPTKPPLKDVVIKFWWDSDIERPKDPIIIIIYQNNVEVGKAILDSDNNWEQIFKDIPFDYEWTLVQENAPEDKMFIFTKELGYHPVKVVEIITIKHHVDTNISQQITNLTTPVYQENIDSEKLPQTGQLWWPVPLLAFSGIIVFFSGYIIEKRR